MYSVIGKLQSRTLRVVWMLEELGLPYELVAAAPRSPDVVAVNPTGKVPVLVVDNTPITDSTAILAYLADHHDNFTFAAGTLERARQDSLTQFLLDEFDAALWMAARHSFILPEELRESAIKKSLKWEFERSQRTLVSRMGEGTYLMGESMTVPDIILAHCGMWAQTARFPIVEPKLADYLERMCNRPALKRAMAAEGGDGD
ncbi:glutathione S-transferase family protein [Aliiruegeria sabulilitoris]|uniref:glutathione S-transferase family protein n=1 Tax=Aliiruegeria sabulilitoris TaxID=1510458 RepID=UPI000829824B|nr:glutathione S-transferase family protein [Aliiruegeria sabulilitoris]NDR58572.1 glutathione S-transferase family protein [Pseudoruegeria sp. M32A2M]